MTVNLTDLVNVEEQIRELQSENKELKEKLEEWSGITLYLLHCLGGEITIDQTDKEVFDVVSRITAQRIGMVSEALEGEGLVRLRLVDINKDEE